MAETWLSQDAFDRLQNELHELTTIGREEASKAIEIARSHGDLRENAEYDSAKEEQGKMEARIHQLTALLRDSKIGEPSNSGKVDQGLVVTLDIEGDVEDFLVGSREDQHDDYEILSFQSPIGKAIMGHAEGDEVKVKLPAGSEIKVTVTSIRTP